MLKRIGSLSAALVMMFNSCPSLVAEATETSQNAWKEKVLFEENFETEVTYEEGASEYIIGRNTTDVYNGWKTGVSGSASVYADDTVFSLLKEGDNQVFTHSRTLGTKGTSGYSNTTFSKAFNITGNKEKPVRFKMKMKAEPSVGAVQISFGGATWLSSDESVITNTGVITRDYDEDKSVTLTVNISNGDFSKDYTFTATIKKADPVYEENVVLNDSFENPEISQTTLIAPGESFNGWIRQNAATGTGFKYEIASEGDNQFLRYYHTGSDIGSYITFKKALTQTIPAKSKIELSFKMKKESGYNGLFEITLGKAAFLFRMSHNYMYPGMYSNSANTAVASVDSDEWNDIKFVIWDTEENGTYGSRIKTFA